MLIIVNIRALIFFSLVSAVVFLALRQRTRRVEQSKSTRVVGLHSRRPKNVTIVVAAPGWSASEHCGGCLVLHHLVHVVNTFFQPQEAQAFLVGMAPSEVPDLNPFYHTAHVPPGFDSSRAIFVYPEVISDNPHGAARVIRWMLYYPGLNGGPSADGVIALETLSRVLHLHFARKCHHRFILLICRLSTCNWTQSIAHRTPPCFKIGAGFCFSTERILFSQELVATFLVLPGRPQTYRGLRTLIVIPEKQSALLCFADTSGVIFLIPSRIARWKRRSWGASQLSMPSLE